MREDKDVIVMERIGFFNKDVIVMERITWILQSLSLADLAATVICSDMFLKYFDSYCMYAR